MILNIIKRLYVIIFTLIIFEILKERGEKKQEKDLGNLFIHFPLCTFDICKSDYIPPTKKNLYIFFRHVT